MAIQPALAQTDTLPPYVDDEIIDNNTVKPGKEIKENPKKKGAYPDGLFIGSDVGMFFGRNSINISFSPYAGYRIGKVLGLGVGVPYAFNYILSSGTRYAAHVYGGRVFARVRPLHMLRGFVSMMYLHAEAAYHAAVLPAFNARWSQPAVNVGIGFMSNFEKGFSFTTDILINALYFDTYSKWNNPQHPYYNHPSVITPLFQYRIGFCYNF